MNAQRQSTVFDRPQPASQGENLRDCAVQSFLTALEGGSGIPATAVRDIVRARASREQFFPDGLFADPAWDILLDLYCAEIDQRRIAVGSLCIGARVPATTALRWIDVLLRHELIEKRTDPLDKRRVFVSLTAQGSEAMQAYFATLPRGILPL